MEPEFRLLHWPEADRASFQHFVEVMADVQTRIAAISGTPGGGVPVPRAPRVPTPRECARMILNQRIELRRIAGPCADMFGDPAWEIIIALFEAGEPLPDEALLNAIGLSPEGLTGPRWIALLVQRGWVERHEDGLTLGAPAEAMLTRYFAGF